MLLKSIKINGLLSFRDVELEIRPLNVLVGANASGKSNLIEIMALLQAVPRDLAGFFRRSGGVSDWLWRGTASDSASNDVGTVGTVEALIAGAAGTPPLRYLLSVAEKDGQLAVAEERLERENAVSSYSNGPNQFFAVSDGAGSLNVRLPAPASVVREAGETSTSASTSTSTRSQSLHTADLPAGQSLLRERKDPALYPEMHFVSRQFDAIRLYREWNMGRNSPVRRPQPTDLPADFLDEDFANLAPVLKQLEGMEAMSVIDEQLGRFYETYEQVGVSACANTAQLWIRERGLNNPVPAARLSDGTLRFLALLSVLCHPKPPPLVCIEEPELGLHPDLMHLVAKLLLAASRRTQLIVTTHSAELLDLLWEDPESLVTFDLYPDTGTEVSRLKKEELTDWLERYQLGELWRTGEIGGNRW